MCGGWCPAQTVPQRTGERGLWGPPAGPRCREQLHVRTGGLSKEGTDGNRWGLGARPSGGAVHPPDGGITPVELVSVGTETILPL